LFSRRWKRVYRYYNPNPSGKRVGDCVIRAISLVTGKGWDDTYMGIVMEGYSVKDMPSSNAVWGNYMIGQGFRRRVLPDSCPLCYRVKDFAGEHSNGTFLLATGSHVVAVVDGDYYDTWDCGDEVPVYYFEKEEK
jgi:hypothetical protein